MRIIDGKLYDYDNNIEADIHYDYFKKEITNEYGEIFKEKDIVEDNGRIGFIFKIYNEEFIVVNIKKNHTLITLLEDLKHTNKKCKYFNKEDILDYPRSLKSLDIMIKSQFNQF